MYFRVLFFLFLLSTHLIHASRKTINALNRLKEEKEKRIHKGISSKKKVGIEETISRDIKTKIIATSNELKHLKATSTPSIVSVNILMILFYGTLGSAMPFLPLFFRQVGITDTEIGYLGALTPTINAIVSPFWGYLADITGKHKLIMLLTFVGSIAMRCLLGFSDKKFIIFSCIVALSAILNAPVKFLLDSMVMGMLKKKSDYGRSRAFGQLGFGIGASIGGAARSMNASYMFLIHALLACITSIAMINFNSSSSSTMPTSTIKQKKSFLLFNNNNGSGSGNNNKSEKGDVRKAILAAITDPKLLVFFSLVFIIGVSSGIIENFAYVRLDEVGADAKSLGVCRLLSSIAGAPAFYMSGKITKTIGINNVLSMSLFSYVFRFFNYSLIKNVWQSIPAEILRGLTFALFWSASTLYVYESSPSGLTATMLGILNCIYAGLGQSIGSLIGGKLARKYGIAKAFYNCGIVNLISLLFFTFFRFVSLKKQIVSSDFPASSISAKGGSEKSK